MSKPVLRPRCWSGKKSTFEPLAKRPVEDGPGVRRRADRTAVLAHERLQRRRRVHVRDRHHLRDVGDVGERLPALLDLVDVGHVGHRAAGVEVGQDHALVVAGEHVGRLGHEVHAAEHDVGGGVVVGREAGQFERVTAGVGPLDDLVALVVVPEDRAAARPGSPWRRRSSRRARRAWPGCSGPAAEPAVSAWWMSPEGCGVPLMAGGDSLVAHRGVVGHGTDMCAGIPGRHTSIRYRAGRRARQWEGATAGALDRSPTAPARTNSRTPPAASSTSGRPRACAAG